MTPHIPPQSTMISEDSKSEEEFRGDADSPTSDDVPKQSKQKQSSNKKTDLLRVVLATMGAIVLVAMVSLLWVDNGNHGHQRLEFFVELDYETAVRTCFQFPFAIELSGESNKLAIELNTIERVFPYGGRVSVVLHGSAALTDAATGIIRELSEVALRFSVGFAVKEGAVLTLDGAELDSLKVYSDNPDVEAIVQRETAEFWRQFVSSRTQWTMDINGLPFKPERDVQLEDNGVFVFGEEAPR